LVELEEGTRLVTNLVGCDPADARIGMPVELVVENVDEEMKLPLFRPAA
ncbi:MAG: OB-fold domain-containing protein, partial [Deltaproteobacteria bacterium]